ncbi:outer membrane beta-barrel protein [Marinobacter sp. AL4B]|uniref:outer membrane beta-barrel protein n=1 Tax=Marinobacter sp. AL4B TaxID=2871173 RepID=UPI001CAA4BEF|nr:outer membrane beta-barrel protein [Marinobacter sp. AL4B]MBZ0333697.1 outer membrane beta-barrel protein [Marinobacter sp. AL4B]
MSLSAVADPVQLVVGQTILTTNNATKVLKENRQDDTKSRTYLNANYENNDGRCVGGLAGSLGYTVWSDDSFDNETDAQMDALGRCELSDSFSWTISNNLREVTQDTSNSDTPNNRTRKNLLSTGPNYLFRLSTVDSVNFEARYESTEFSEPEERDSERVIGTAAWNHLFSSTMNGGLSLTTSETEHDSSGTIEVRTAQMTFGKRWATASLSGALGVSEIETEFGATSSTSRGSVGNLEFIREINERAELYLRGARELTDSTSSFDIRFEEFEFNLTESLAVETSSLEAGLNKRFSSGSSLSAAVFANNSDYLDSNEEEQSTGVRLSASKPLSQLVSLFAKYGYRYTTFEQDESEDEQLNMEMGLNYQASRALSVYASVGYEEKGSDVVARRYGERWALVGLEYQLR